MRDSSRISPLFPGSSRRDLCLVPLDFHVLCFPPSHLAPSITLHTPRHLHVPTILLQPSTPHLSTRNRARAYARARAHDLTLTEQLPTFASLQPQPYPTSLYLSPFLTFFDLPLCICIYTHIPASDGLFAHFSLYLASHANTRLLTLSPSLSRAFFSCCDLHHLNPLHLSHETPPRAPTSSRRHLIRLHASLQPSSLAR